MYFTLGKIQLFNPYISTALNSDKSNWEYFLTPVLQDTSLNSAPDSLQTIKKDSLLIYYRIDTFTVNQGRITFNDNTLNREFTYTIDSIDIESYEIQEQNNHIPLSFAMNFTNQGKFQGQSAFSIQSPDYLTFEGKINNLDLHSFSPYSEYFIAYPIISGLLNYDISIEMNPSHLQNNNHILVQEMEFGKRTKDSTASKLPVKLALYLIKDAKDNIDFTIPVSGNPSDPGFKLGPLIWQTFGRFITKTATQPFTSLAKLVGTHPEELERIPINYTSDSLNFNQRKVLDKIAEILHKKQDLIFSFRQEIAIDEFLSNSTKKDLRWSEIDDTNEKFNQYLLRNYPDLGDISTPIPYLNLIDREALQSQLHQLYQQRNQQLYTYLTLVKNCAASSVKLHQADFVNMPEELKSPGFRVEVSMK
jgi:hypothetical protein